MKSQLGTMVAFGTRGGGIAALGLLLIIYIGSSAPARALQVLEASDHAELTAEISDTDVNRIALDGDRVSRVIQSPGGFTVEHDPVRGDLYLYPDAAPARRAADPFGAAEGSGARARATLYLGTEQGFTYRLSLSAVPRGSAQILIRNAAVTASAAGRTRPAADERQDEAVSLILAVARREPVAGYVVVPVPEGVMSAERSSLMELWRGLRFTARVLRTPDGGVEDAQQLASRSGANVVAAWLSAPGRGPNGERIGVLVEDNFAEPVR